MAGPRHRDVVRLGTVLVADEYHRSAAVVKLVKVWPHVLHIPKTAKSMQEAHCRLAPAPRLNRCLTIEALCWCVVEEEDRGVLTASPQNSEGILCCFSRARAMARIDWFHLSTRPF